jgi:hypothetical protein
MVSIDTADTDRVGAEHRGKAGLGCDKRCELGGWAVSGDPKEPCFLGAGNRIRTDDLQHGNTLLAPIAPARSFTSPDDPAGRACRRAPSRPVIRRPKCDLGCAIAIGGASWNS